MPRMKKQSFKTKAKIARKRRAEKCEANPNYLEEQRERARLYMKMKRESDPNDKTRQKKYAEESREKKQKFKEVDGIIELKKRVKQEKKISRKSAVSTFEITPYEPSIPLLSGFEELVEESPTTIKQEPTDDDPLVFSLEADLNQALEETRKKFACEICHKKFARKDYMKVHQKFHDKSRPKPFECDRCDYSTDRKTILEKHKKYHERLDEKFEDADEQVKCKKCWKILRDKNALRIHMKVVHSKKGEKKKD